jgi:hypothetical protein
MKECKSGIVREVWLWIVGTCFFLSLGGWALVADGLPDGVGVNAFREFLESNPDVKVIEFSVDPGLFHDVSNSKLPATEKPHPKGLVRYIGGKQGDSYYIRQVDNESVRNTVFQDNTISGKSRDNYWVINGTNSLSFSPANESSEALKASPSAGVSRDRSLRLWNFLMLGIPIAKYRTLHWVDATNFEALSLGNAKIRGHIAAYSNGLPSRIECQIDGEKDNRTHIVEYQYKSENMPVGIPFRFLLGIIINGGTRMSTYPFQIERLELGQASLPEEGYVPSQFLNGDDTRQVPIVYYSNRIRYIMSQNGRMVADSKGMGKSLEEKRYRAAYFVGAIVLGNIGFLMHWKYRKQKRQCEI